MPNSEEVARERRKERAELKDDLFAALNAAGMTKLAFAEQVGFSPRFVEYYFSGEYDSERLEMLIGRFIAEQAPTVTRRGRELEERYGQPA